MKFLKIFVAVLSCTSFLFVQAEGSTAEEQARIKAQEQVDQKASELIIHGKVVSVDLIANTIIVKTKRAQDTLNIESGAKIMLGSMELSKEITLDDLQTDVKVTVTWKVINGKKTATKIVEESVFDSRKETH